MQNELINPKSKKVSVIAGGITALVGILFLFINAYVGVLVLIAAVICFFSIRSNYQKEIHLIFQSGGFSVQLSNRANIISTKSYPFHEVTETLFYQDETKSHFRAKSRDAVAFDLYEAPGFDQMIDLFNQNTPHLPYFWEKSGDSYQKISR